MIEAKTRCSLKKTTTTKKNNKQQKTKTNYLLYWFEELCFLYVQDWLLSDVRVLFQSEISTSKISDDYQNLNERYNQIRWVVSVQVIEWNHAITCYLISRFKFETRFFWRKQVSFKWFPLSLISKWFDFKVKR